MPFGRRQDDRVPPEVEEHLVAQVKRSMQALNVPSRGGRLAARLQKTVIEERTGTAWGSREDVLERVRAAVGAAPLLPAGGGLVRYALLSRNLSGVVIDLGFAVPDGAAPATSPAGGSQHNGDGIPVHLRVYGKEGALDHSPTRSAAEAVWAAVLAATSHGPAGLDGRGGDADRDRPDLSDVTKAFLDRIEPVIDELTRSVIPPEWATVWLVSEQEEYDNAGYTAYYLVEGPEPVVHSMSAPTDAIVAFQQLWLDARRCISPWAWTSATLVVTRREGEDASANIHYAYDPVPIEKHAERAEHWQRRYLPPVPIVHDRNW